MEFLRTVYNALAVIGTVVICFVVVGVVAAHLDDIARSRETVANRAGNPAQTAGVERRQERARQAAAAPGAATPSAPPPAPIGLPMGVTEAQSRGILHDADAQVFLVINDRPVSGARKAWVERHGPELYLLVSSDSYLIDRPPSGGRWALQLRDGRRIALTRFADARGQRFAYSRLCAAPADSLLAVAVPRDSFVNAARVPCQ